MSLCLGPRHVPAAPSVSAREGARPFNHVKCAPSLALAPFVDHYWLSRWDRRGHAPRMAASLLDPCFHLHIRDGVAEVMGVVRGTYQVCIEGIGCVVGVKFRVGGFYAFNRRPAATWTNRTAPADDVFDGTDGRRAMWARELTEAAVECSGDAAAHAAIIATHLDAFLSARSPTRDADAEHVAALVALIAARADLRRVSDLVQASGRSERTLHRLFSRYVGVSPVWVIRRHRLRAAAELLMARKPADVRTVAWELGYADQAHFIRDFRATIGVTPGAYVQARL
ncbi:MAG: helix-turn-helix domain-containing protein [bacterium]